MPPSDQEIQSELERLWWCSKVEDHLMGVPYLTITRTRRWKDHPRGCSGRAYARSHRVHLSIGPACTTVRWKAMLAHEVAHHLAGLDARHSQRYWDVYAQLVRDAYGVDVPRLTGRHAVKQLTVENAMESSRKVAA